MARAKPNRMGDAAGNTVKPASTVQPGEVMKTQRIKAESEAQPVEGMEGQYVVTEYENGDTRYTRVDLDPRFTRRGRRTGGSQ